jgi:hypothetical protein
MSTNNDKPGELSADEELIMNEIIQRNFLIPSKNVIDSGILNRPDAEQIRRCMKEYVQSLTAENDRLRKGSEAVALLELIKYSDRYEINIQFWPEQTAVYIAKDGVELTDFGGEKDIVIKQSIDYLKRITTQNPK